MREIKQRKNRQFLQDTIEKRQLKHNIITLCKDNTNCSSVRCVVFGVLRGSVTQILSQRGRAHVRDDPLSTRCPCCVLSPSACIAHCISSDSNGCSSPERSVCDRDQNAAGKGHATEQVSTD